MIVINPLRTYLKQHGISLPEVYIDKTSIGQIVLIDAEKEIKLAMMRTSGLNLIHEIRLTHRESRGICINAEEKEQSTET